MSNPATSYDFDYEYNESNTIDEENPHEPTPVTVPVDRKILSALYIITFLLGIFGNGVVIWISGLKMKKSVNTTWYLSLAVSDFIFCAWLPFTVMDLIKSEWVFGLFMCKFTSFVMFLNMFSSIFLLVLISMDRCLTVVFPVWSQNHRTVKAASVLVVFAWIISALLSVPSLIFRDITTDRYTGKTACHNDYPKGPDKTLHRAVPASRFVFGFVIPFLIITICYVVIIQKLTRNRMTKSSKPFKVMSALIVTFFICWLPYHVFILLELDHTKHGKALTIGTRAAVILASANSFLNPFLYAFMGKDFKKTYRSWMLSKIENALSDDALISSKRQSITQDSKVSTHI